MNSSSCSSGQYGSSDEQHEDKPSDHAEGISSTIENQLQGYFKQKFTAGNFKTVKFNDKAPKIKLSSLEIPTVEERKNPSPATK